MGLTEIKYLAQCDRHLLIWTTEKNLDQSRSQRPRSFWSVSGIATSGQVQRHSVFEWIYKHNRLRPQPIRFVRLDTEHAQRDGKSVNRGLPLLDLARGEARGRDSWCWPKKARPLGTRMGRDKEGTVLILVPRAYDPSGLRQESRALGATISGMRHGWRLRETGWAEFGYFLCYFKMVAPRALDSCRRPEGS